MVCQFLQSTEMNDFCAQGIQKCPKLSGEKRINKSETENYAAFKGSFYPHVLFWCFGEYVCVNF